MAFRDALEQCSRWRKTRSKENGTMCCPLLCGGRLNLGAHLVVCEPGPYSDRHALDGDVILPQDARERVHGRHVPLAIRERSDFRNETHQLRAVTCAPVQIEEQHKKALAQCWDLLAFKPGPHAPIEFPRFGSFGRLVASLRALQVPRSRSGYLTV